MFLNTSSAIGARGVAGAWPRRVAPLTRQTARATVAVANLRRARLIYPLGPDKAFAVKRRRADRGRSALSVETLRDYWVGGVGWAPRPPPRPPSGAPPRAPSGGFSSPPISATALAPPASRPATAAPFGRLLLATDPGEVLRSRRTAAARHPVKRPGEMVGRG